MDDSNTGDGNRFVTSPYERDKLKYRIFYETIINTSNNPQKCVI